MIWNLIHNQIFLIFKWNALKANLDMHNSLEVYYIQLSMKTKD